MKQKIIYPGTDPLTQAQDRAIDEMIAQATSVGGSGAALQASDPGTGKTAQAVESILRMWARRSIIIAPLTTWDGWRDTMLAQSDGQESLKLCANSKLDGVSAKDARQNLADLLVGKRGHYFIGREFFTSLDWEMIVQYDDYGAELKDDKGKLVKKPHQKRIYAKLGFDYAVYDESHMVAKKGNRGWYSWNTIKADLKVQSSGTWYGNKPDNMHGATRTLWPDVIPASKDTWASQWMATEYDHFSWNKSKVIGEKNPGAFVSSLPCYISIKQDKGAPPLPEIRSVDLSPEQRKAYDEVEKNMVTWIEQNPLVIEFPIALGARLRQLSLGMFSIRHDEDGEEDVYFETNCKSTKYDELVSIMHEYPEEKMVIFTHSARFAKVVVEKLNARKDQAGLFAGQKWQKRSDRDAVKQRFLDDPSMMYLVCVIQAAGTGLDGLQAVCRTVVFLSEVEGSEIDQLQAVSRIWRTGGSDWIRYIVIQARDTRDANVTSNLIQKALDNNKIRAKL